MLKMNYVLRFLGFGFTTGNVGCGILTICWSRLEAFVVVSARKMLFMNWHLFSSSYQTAIGHLSILLAAILRHAMLMLELCCSFPRILLGEYLRFFIGDFLVHFCTLAWRIAMHFCCRVSLTQLLLAVFAAVVLVLPTSSSLFFSSLAKRLAILCHDHVC